MDDADQKTAPSLFLAFNAKHLSTRRIAENFITSPKFSEIAGRWNSLLIGPRGSGKTTLLRMLQVNSLRFWNTPEADRFCGAIDYTGIFVPADVAWQGMLTALRQKATDPQLGMTLVESAFTTSVLLGMVEAMDSRVTPTVGSVRPMYRLATPSPAFKDTLVSICHLWRLTPRVMSLAGIRSALQERLLQIVDAAANLATDKSITLERMRSEYVYLTLGMNEAVISAADTFDRDVGEPEARWSPLLDEFEIAPECIQRQVLSRLRSDNQKVIYKISLAPCTDMGVHLTGTSSPISPGNDFKPTVLWYADKASSQDFSERIFLSIVKAHRKLASRNANHILGQTSSLSEDEGTLAERSNSIKAAFQSLTVKDSSFQKFIIEKKIDPQNLETNKLSPTGNLVRKIAPLVAFREAYWRQGGATIRGRKRLAFAYSGQAALFAICEGNPRWLIGLTNMMMSKVDENDSMIHEAVQLSEIYAAANQFWAMLTSVASRQRPGTSSQPVSQLLQTIGTYFFTRLVRDSFIEEPPLSFEVDDAVDDDVLQNLMIAFNFGAIVDVTRDGSYDYDRSGLRGKRFRLAYMLAPVLRLPLRYTKSVSLSTMLKGAGSAKSYEQRDSLAASNSAARIPKPGETRDLFGKQT